MSTYTLVLPLVAAGSLTIALLLPLRDGRRGDRATLRGVTPLFRLFPSANATTERSPAVPVATRAPKRWTSLLDPKIFATFAAVLGDLAPAIVRSETSTSVARSRDGTCAEVRSADVTSDESAFGDPSADSPTDDRATFASLVAHVTDHTSGAHDRSGDAGIRPAATGESLPPLTRSRLPTVSTAIAWPVDSGESEADSIPHDRHAKLLELAHAPDDANASALHAGLRHANAAERLSILRILERTSGAATQVIFHDLLRTGSDTERALAVDVLARCGERSALVEAFADRVDAVAARAAFAYVGTNVRSDYESILTTYVDRHRLERILDLLGGVLE